MTPQQTIAVTKILTKIGISRFQEPEYHDPAGAVVLVTSDRYIAVIWAHGKIHWSDEFGGVCSSYESSRRDKLLDNETSVER